MMHLPREYPRWSRSRRHAGSLIVWRQLRMNAAGAAIRRGAAAKSSASAPHVAFALAFRPSERLLHRFALMVSQAHLGQDGLRIDLLGDLRRRRRGGDRQDLMLVRIWIMKERTLRRSFLSPCLQRGELLKRRQVV